MRILLLEDDELIGDGIKIGLGSKGFSVDWLTNGLVARHALNDTRYDAVILDLTLPGEDGLRLLEYWRSHGLRTPVLILTARDAINQRIKGLDKGADDYMGKPFALNELAARLRALVRRNCDQPEPEIRHGDLCFNSSTRTLTKRGDVVLLSPKELALVELFLRNGQRVLSKSLIEDKLYTWDDAISSNTVEVHIHHIRRKLGNDFIRTVPKAGYALGKVEGNK